MLPDLVRSMVSDTLSSQNRFDQSSFSHFQPFIYLIFVYFCLLLEPLFASTHGAARRPPGV